MSRFEIAALILLFLIFLCLFTAVHWLSTIAKVLALISQQIQSHSSSDLSGQIADGMEEHDRRVERELKRDIVDLKS